MATEDQYVVATAKAVGRYGVFTTTSVSADTSTLICSSLISSDIAATGYDQMWVRIRSGALAEGLSRILRGSFDGTTGTITVDTPFSGTPASGISFDVMSLAPPRGVMAVVGLRDCVNWALQHLWFRDRIAMVGVTNQQEYSLGSSYWWLEDPARLLAIYSPISVAGEVPTRYHGPWSLRLDGESNVLELKSAPFTTGQTFWVEVLRPGNSRLKVGGSWTDQTDPTAAMTSVSDEALPSVNFVVAGAAYHLYDMLLNQAEDSQYFREQRRKWARAFVRAKRLHLPKNDGVPRIWDNTYAMSDWSAAW